MEILDDNSLDTFNDKRTKNIKQRSWIYLLIMIIGGSIYIYFAILKMFIPYLLIITSFGYILTAIVISIILESFRHLMRKRKERKAVVKSKYDPFWYQVLEGGFAIWILLMGIIILGNYVA